MSTTRQEWNAGYVDGRRYRRLTAPERSLLSEHVPAPAGGRALDVGCGVGELAAHLSSLGYRVDAVDWSEHALAEAAAGHAAAARWLHLDIEADDWAALHADGYDLITLRFVYPFLRHRDGTLRALGRRLRPGGALVVIVPKAADTPSPRRGIALDEEELSRLRAGWPSADRHDTDGLSVVVLRGPHSGHDAGYAAGDGVPGSPREHHLHLRPRSYAQVESGRKTIEVRVATPALRTVAEGDTIVFHDRATDRQLDVLVRRITAHASFGELLAAHDSRRVDPDARHAELLGVLRGTHPPTEEEPGVLAFEFDHRPARPGQPLPMAPADYLTTIPHYTMYSCLYVRDADDRPVQLRSVYGKRLWQFPGGISDAGEDPLGTARREAVEETGLALGPGRPRLLLTHYLHPGPRWPMGKIGFVFDGGNLTPGQLRRIRLDPQEHDLWAVHGLDEWRRLMGEVPYARLAAVERARTDQGPHYLVTDSV
ncbi:methyltransferase domain-containing protein [Streptomyces olivaceus]|uniref:methyltransferase domain-containing protein n=1 Tax=Streptomyces olivaceus TaxID=47716 RepID=UPI0036F1838F